mmetsp:Transcript_13245/g.24323  ORF Transcript_13245/g.24323 Transcript_13245/m.24323 type:complete len:317 (-) Transcript_13245:9954-10904(-)
MWRANMGLSALNRLLPTKYKALTSKAVPKSPSLFLTSSFLFLGSLSTPSKSLMKLARLYWYMEFTASNWLIKKKSLLPSFAKPLYTSRCLSSSSLALPLSSSAVAILLAASFVLVSVSMRATFCNKSPSAVLSASSKFFSRPASSTLYASSCASISLFCFSSSGCSTCSTTPRSWPSKPLLVMVKLTSVTRAAASGGRLGLGFLVTKTILNVSAKSSTLSPTFTTQRAPSCCKSLLARGYSMGSNPSTSMMSRVLPNLTQSSTWLVNLGSPDATTSIPVLLSLPKYCFSQAVETSAGSMMKGTFSGLKLLTTMPFS